MNEGNSGFLSRDDLSDLVALRHALHQQPELSGEEVETARLIAARLAAMGADEVVTGLGGYGVAAVFNGRDSGPTVLFRAELDGLPIAEVSAAPYRSQVPGRGHLCGHDGHMATLMALALGLSRQRPARGRVVLMFQPAEENGAGAAAVIADPAFAALQPDLSFSWHNWPGVPLGTVALKSGPVNCTSRGMMITLKGRTAHASLPETGVSPMNALARLMPALTALSDDAGLTPDFRLVTVTHCRMGEPAFGIAPGDATLYATLRTLTDDRMAALVADAEALAQREAAAGGLTLSISWHDVFDHVENAPEAVAHLDAALKAEGLTVTEAGLPKRGSEDFGRFGQKAPAAMAFFGAGESVAALHNPDYDFPDALIASAAAVMMRVAREIVG